MAATNTSHVSNRTSRFRRLRDREDPFWDFNPRWQTEAIRRIMRKVARGHLSHRLNTPEFELLVGRVLGQPLSLRVWDRMTFNDKLTYRRLRDHDPRFPVFCDKLRMRDYVVERLGDVAVPRMLKSADSAEAFSDLIGPFAFKANHGSGWVILVNDARQLTENEKRRAQSWLAVNYGTSYRELGYCSARPLLYAEELLARDAPPDFKFFVFNGTPLVVQVDFDRFTAHQRVLMSSDWLPLGSLAYPLPSEIPAAPPNLKKMLEWAAILADGTDFLRVDLYDLGDRVLVGELSCYPEAGRGRFRPERLDTWLGQQWTSKPNGTPSPSPGATGV